MNLTKEVFPSIVILLCCLLSLVSSKKPPHIIYIIVDDLGWNDVSFHGSKQIPTPNIDALAKDGVILNNYYVQPICTPSRGALMTGKYPLRIGLQHDVIYANAPWGLGTEEKILPQYLKELGYKTHGVGKWHLGFFHESYLPVNRGFDSFFGFWTGKGDHFTHYEETDGMHGLDFHDNNVNAWSYTGNYSVDIFTHKVKRVIKKHDSSKPLFLYLAHQAVHSGNSYSPLQAPTEYIERFAHIKDRDRRSFAGMVSALDDSIGELMNALKNAGILEDAIIVFTTDNGAAVEGIDLSTGSNWPLRGSKYNMWEGGVRGVAFVWSSSLRKAKEKVSTQMMHITDWLPTLYSVAGGDMKNLAKIDGFDQWQAICCNVKGPRQMIIHNIDPKWKVEGIRKGRYKLLKGSVFEGKFDGWFDQEGKKKDNQPFSTADMKTYDKKYTKLWKKSKVVSVLHKLYGKTKALSHSAKFCVPETKYCKLEQDKSLKSSVLKDKYESLIEVKCGERPENYSTNCQPMKSACLFDIENDPCEYNNLASMESQVVQELEEDLDKYRAQTVHVNNKPQDPQSNPKYHGYAWVPWKKSLHGHN